MKAAVGNATVIADGGYRDTGLVIPHRLSATSLNSRPAKKNITGQH